MANQAKLRLSLDELQVESFDVGDGVGAGTVHGHDPFGGMVLYEYESPPVSCGGSCDTCPGHVTCTCPATCPNTCQPSCYGTCPPPCPVPSGEPWTYECTCNFTCDTCACE